MVSSNNEGPQTARPTPVDPGTELAHEEPVDNSAPVEPIDPVTHVQVDMTLGAYALNLMHGGQLAPFEQAHLIAIALRAGAEVTPGHARMAEARDSRSAAVKAKLDEREALLEVLAQCRDQFRRYEQLHSLKPDGAGQEKAAVNGAFAARCDAAIKGCA